MHADGIQLGDRMSHPSWVRGLKPPIGEDLQHDITSHPSWVRGLKLSLQMKKYVTTLVAPLVGAWIETLATEPVDSIVSSHPLVGAWIETKLDDWHKMDFGRTPRGCVD